MKGSLQQIAKTLNSKSDYPLLNKHYKLSNIGLFFYILVLHHFTVAVIYFIHCSDLVLCSLVGNDCCFVAVSECSWYLICSADKGSFTVVYVD